VGKDLFISYSRRNKVGLLGIYKVLGRSSGHIFMGCGLGVCIRGMRRYVKKKKKKWRLPLSGKARTF